LNYESPYKSSTAYPMRFADSLREGRIRFKAFAEVHLSTTSQNIGGIVTAAPSSFAPTNTFTTDADGAWINSATVATTAECSGRETTVGVAQLRHYPILGCTFQTGSSLADQRIFVGFLGSTFTGAASDNFAASYDALGFFYSSSTYPSWHAVSAEVAGGTQTITPLGVAIAASTRYEVWVAVVSSTLAMFWIGTAASGKPSGMSGPFPITIKSGTVLNSARFLVCGLENKANTSRAIRWSRFDLSRE